MLSVLEQANRQRTKLGSRLTFWLAHFVENGCFYVVEELITEPLLRDVISESGPFSEKKVIDLSICMMEILCSFHALAIDGN